MQKANAKRTNQMTAQELLTVCESATSRKAIEPIVKEFTRRKTNAKERTHAKSGKPLSEAFIKGKLAKIEKNLVLATSYMNTFGKVAPASVPSTFVAKPNGLTKAEATRLTNLLAKFKA